MEPFSWFKRLVYSPLQQIYLQLIRKGDEATSHDDSAFRTAPRWAGVLREMLSKVLAGQRRIHQHIGSEADADYERDVAIMATLDEVIAKATEAKTVSESTNIAVREVIRLLKESVADPAKLDEAVALLEAMRANDAEMLTDNTPPPASGF